MKLETRTSNAALRTNYFFENPNENIKLKFTGEQIEYTLSKGNANGIYYIDMTPKIATETRAFSIEINGTPMTTKLP